MNTVHAIKYREIMLKIAIFKWELALKCNLSNWMKHNKNAFQNWTVATVKAFSIEYMLELSSSQ